MDSVWLLMQCALTVAVYFVGRKVGFEKGYKEGYELGNADGRMIERVKKGKTNGNS